MTGRLSARAQFVLALVLDVVGAGGALLVAGRDWQTLTTRRSRPFADTVLGVSGRTIDSLPTALALVALAGSVAVLATRGLPRRAVGGLVALAGAGLAWRSIIAMSAIDFGRARELVRAEQHVSIGSSFVPSVATHPAWAVLSIACGLVVMAAGALVAVRGSGWTELSARYENPAGRADPTDASERARADAHLWSAFDRGDDPTSDPRDTE